MTRRGRWRRRAALSMLAGGGLGAAGLVGPVAALGVETATTTTSSGTETPPPVTETTPQAPAPEPSKGTQPPAEQPTTTSSTPSVPAGSGSGGEGASGTSTGTTPTTPTTSASPAPTPASSQAQGEGSTAPTVVVQRKQQTTRGGHTPKHTSSTGSTTAQGTQTQAGEKGAKGSHHGPATVPPGTPNGVAPAPQAVGGEAGALAALLANSAVSAQALDFYRVPLFLLPIYQAAAVQYDVPWQILAAINEVETDFGTDQSVSTAGAVGWMQFMPATWLMYGVDATDAGYADPYNPVDAIFAAARYLHAAGASRNVRRAVFAYNHSQAYVESVMLRARLIAGYPSSVIGTLTGLVDGRLPTAGAHASPGAVYLPAASAAVPGAEGSAVSGTESSAAETPSSGAPVAPAPSVAGAVATGAGVTATGAGGSSATAGAVPANPLAAGTTTPNGVAASSTAQGHTSARAADAAQLPGSTPPPPPLVVARRAEAAANAGASPAQLMELSGTPGAAVVAVESGRVVHLGHSRALGRYLVLRDVYGDIFTYAGLGSIAPRYRRPTPPENVAQHTPGSAANTAAAGGAGSGTGSGGSTGGGGSAGSGGGTGTSEAAADPVPRIAASAGHQRPTTLSVKRNADSAAAPPPEPEAEGETAAGGMGKVRLYAHPHNPLARAASARARAHGNSGRWLPLRTGSLVTQGTVLGHLAATPAPEAGKLRFAVRPAGDNGTVDPRALLDNLRELAVAMHPRGSKGRLELLGATAQQVFAMSKSELQRSVLSDPGITLDACGRRDVQEGAVDRRVLGTLEFLSRSGLQPTVGALRCARGRTTAAGPVFEHFAGGWVDIVAINGIPIAGHQGPKSITDATIRALLTLHGQWLPSRIYSLMEYPHAPNTLAHTADWNRIRLAFGSRIASARGAHASAARRSPVAVAAGGSLSRAQWDRLISRIAAIPQPKVASGPSPSAIRDPQAAPTNGALGG